MFFGLFWVAARKTPVRYRFLGAVLLEAGWELLINLGRDAGDEELVRTFSAALRDEKEHLRGVRGLVARLTREQVMVENNLPET